MAGDLGLLGPVDGPIRRRPLEGKDLRVQKETIVGLVLVLAIAFTVIIVMNFLQLEAQHKESASVLQARPAKPPLRPERPVRISKPVYQFDASAGTLSPYARKRIEAKHRLIDLGEYGIVAEKEIS